MSTDLLTHYRKQQSIESSKWLNEQRELAFDFIARSGFPSQREEYWKHTKVAPYLEQQFVKDSRQSGSYTEILAPYLWPDCYHLVFIDGTFIPECSTSMNTDAVTITSIQQALQVQSLNQLLAEQLGVLSRNHQSFVPLNAGLWTDGACVMIHQEGFHGNKPLQILFVSHSQSKKLNALKNFYQLAKNSSIQLSECYLSLENPAEQSYFNCATSELLIKENARCTFLHLTEEHAQGLHWSAMFCEQEDHSELQYTSLAWGGQSTRKEVVVNLHGNQANAALSGLYFANEQQQVDYHTTVRHSHAQCTSDQFFRGVLQDSANGICVSKVFVDPAADGTLSKQLNNNIMLSKNATMHTQPQLEIHARDVQCTHGATVGQLDKEILFYLKSRGLTDEHAKQLLLEGFINEPFTRNLPKAWQNLLRDKLQQQLLQLTKRGL